MNYKIASMAVPLVLLAGIVGSRVFAQAPPPPSSSVHLVVSGVERVPAPLPITAPMTATPSPSSIPQDLFVSVKVYYSDTTNLLHFYAGDISLRDAYGAVQSPRTCDASGKLTSKSLIAPSPTVSATMSGCLRYTASLGAASSMALQYFHTEQIAQNAPPTFYHASAAVPNPPAPSGRRVYATATQPALRACLLDEALAGGYITLNVDPLYANGADATVPGAVRAYIARQAARLAADHQAFLAVPAVPASADVRKERLEADTILTAIENDLATAGTLRSNARWMQWHAAFTAHNGALAALYDGWPAVVPAP